MPNFGLFPLASTLVASATVTTNGNTANLTIPLASSYRFTVEVTASSSNTSQLNVGIYSSTDGGTTYGLIAWTTNMSQTLGGQQFLFRPFLNAGDTATVVTNYILGTVTAASNTQLVNNGPFDPRFIKVAWVCPGTSSSCTFAVKVTSIPQDLSD